MGAKWPTRHRPGAAQARRGGSDRSRHRRAVSQARRPADGRDDWPQEEIRLICSSSAWQGTCRCWILRKLRKRLRKSGVAVLSTVGFLLSPLAKSNKSAEQSMPKMKSKSWRKSVESVGNGGVKRRWHSSANILTKKTTKTKRQLRGTVMVHSTNMAAVRAMLPLRLGVNYASRQTWRYRPCPSQEASSRLPKAIAVVAKRIPDRQTGGDEGRSIRLP